MNFYTMLGVVFSLLGGSMLDEIKRHEMTTDANKQLTKVVLESAKVRVTIEKLSSPAPVNNKDWYTNVILTPNLILTNLFSTNDQIQWLPSVQAVDLKPQ